MRQPVVILLPLLVWLGSCTGVAHRNSNCEWPQEAAALLDLQNPGQQQHLSDDALLAEDLAIRYADATRGQRSGHYAGAAVYVQTRDVCMATLFNTIAKNHSVTSAQVRESLIKRRMSFDAGVILSFVVFFWFVADRLTQRVSRRFPPREGRAPALMLTAVISVGVSFAGALLGELWSFIAEGYRLGNGHLSYRASRIPWVHHRMGFFGACLLLFWVTAALRFRISSRQ